MIWVEVAAASCCGEVVIEDLGVSTLQCERGTDVEAL
eukprot:COSAG02_NODE_4176_length_5666_cov_3.555416_3_plen_37_part_00